MPVIYYNPITQMYVVAECYNNNWTPLNTKWMADDIIGQDGLILDIDIVKNHFVFDNIQAASEKMAELWRKCANS